MIENEFQTRFGGRQEKKKDIIAFALGMKFPTVPLLCLLIFFFPFSS